MYKQTNVGCAETFFFVEPQKKTRTSIYTIYSHRETSKILVSHINNKVKGQHFFYYEKPLVLGSFCWSVKLNKIQANTPRQIYYYSKSSESILILKQNKNNKITTGWDKLAWHF